MSWIRLLIGPAISAILMVAIGFLHSWRLGLGALSIFTSVALMYLALSLKATDQPSPRLQTRFAILRIAIYALMALASPWTLAAIFYRGPLGNAVLITIVGAAAILALQRIYWRLGGRTLI